MSSRVEPPTRAICVTSNLALRKTLRRTLSASGSNVEFIETLVTEKKISPEAAMLFIDQACRSSTTADELTQIIGQGGHIIILGDTLENDEVVQMLRAAAVNHVISDADNLDEVELIVTSVKLQSGDIFGLEKYLAWGAKVDTHSVNTYEEKRLALLRIVKHAKGLGARRHVVAKIESVTDELLMNALYDAPAVSKGIAPADRSNTPADIAKAYSDQAATLRYACDGRYFAVSVQDNYGELHKDAILDHLVRARVEKGAPKMGNGPGAGAGLGLYFILSSVTRFIANIEKGQRTEVICLFDLKETGRQAPSCTRSLHIFTK